VHGQVLHATYAYYSWVISYLNICQWLQLVSINFVSLLMCPHLQWQQRACTPVQPHNVRRWNGSEDRVWAVTSHDKTLQCDCILSFRCAPPIGMSSTSSVTTQCLLRSWEFHYLSVIYWTIMHRSTAVPDQ
jgi:hypothetical protein